MSGWLLAWSRERLDEERWARALALLPDGDYPQQRSGNSWRIAAWRRSKGEFPLSGTLQAVPDGGTLAWVGQTLGDQGDISSGTIESIAAGADHAALSAINGPFAAAVARSDSSVTILTDRYRHYPVYIHVTPDLVVASTDIRPLVALLDSPEVDRESVELLLRCGELIDRMTLVRGIELLPPATIVSISATSAGERRYWRMRHDADQKTRFDDLARNIGDALHAATSRIQRASPSLAITLSGGLDSRFILALCENPAQIPSFTWGNPGCRDIQCAAAFARRIGSPHTIRHWEPEAFPPLWSKGAELTAGSFGVESMYMLPFVGLLQSHANVILNGLAGDAFLGGNFLRLSWMRERNLRSLGAASWRWRVTEEQDRAVSSLLGGPGTGRERWVESIARELHGRPVDRLNDWLYENRVFRNTNSGTMLLRSAVESHAPFFDREVADLLLATPHEYKFKHRLYLAVLNRAAPQAAAVPWQRTNIPPSWGFAANTASMAFQRIAKAAGKRVGIELFRSLPVADPAAWLRGPWRDPARTILFDERTLSRRLVQPDALRRLWDDHQRGANHTRHLGSLIAIELFCRDALDCKGAPAPEPVEAAAP
jgi:asparagine synthase (glutamine-hydrolysing)